MPNPEKLREVGFVFDHWPQKFSGSVWNDGRWSFRENYFLGSLTELKVKLKLKMDTYVPPILDITNRGAYITLDLRFNYYNSFGTVIRSDLIGVIIGNFMNDNINKPIFWKDFDSVNNINKILLKVIT